MQSRLTKAIRVESTLCQTYQQLCPELLWNSASFSNSSRPPLPAQRLILGNLPDALRLPAAHLNRRDLFVIGDAASDLVPPGLDFF